MSSGYTVRFTRPNTDKSSARWPDFTRQRAPHKPLLLLAVMDLLAQGSLPHNLIELNAELGELFTLYWSTIFPPDTGKRGNIAMPFWHLSSENLTPIAGKRQFARPFTHLRRPQPHRPW